MQLVVLSQAGLLCQDWRAKGDEDAATMESVTAQGMGGPKVWAEAVWDSEMRLWDQ